MTGRDLIAAAVVVAAVDHLVSDKDFVDVSDKLRLAARNESSLIALEVEISKCKHTKK